MCGIAGIAFGKMESSLENNVTQMIQVLRHRGPDDSGIWSDEKGKIALGHRRLSILDLSPLGCQPMVSVNSRYVIAFNGEIYNFEKIRADLTTSKPTQWRGNSDTEVLVAAFEQWGIERTLQSLVGMFAIALWDRQEQTLMLARDRFGEKPLYYGFVKQKFIFSSELKAIKEVCGSELDIDRDALASFMRFGYIPAPQSIYNGLFKLLPGHYLIVNAHHTKLVPKSYWKLSDTFQGELSAKLKNCSDKYAIDMTQARLQEAVSLQMVSDVPLGAFLSGGVDSSTIVALMQASSTRRVQTYTIGFNEDSFNEAPYAKAVADHLGTEHTELYVAAKDAVDLIPQLPLIYDEPFADSSQIPTTLVSQLTRQHVTVSLSGDGGDELFAGYPRYGLTHSLWQKVNRRSMLLRQILAGVLKSISAQSWDRLLFPLPSSQRQRINGRRIHRLAQMITSSTINEMYLRLVSQWQQEDRIVLGASATMYQRPWVETGDLINEMRFWDVNQYLSDDLLVKVDRAAMSASLETRAPILDHRVAELAFALPQKMLMRDGVGKWILRQVLDRYVPRKLIERPKTGFSIPLALWLRGELRSWAEPLLDPDKMAQQGYLNTDKVTDMWREHLSGTYDRSPYLWNVLMFQAWLYASDKAPN